MNSIWSKSGCGRPIYKGRNKCRKALAKSMYAICKKQKQCNRATCISHMSGLKLLQSNAGLHAIALRKVVFGSKFHKLTGR